MSLLYGVGINLLMLSRADEEISTDVELELELKPQEALLKSPSYHSTVHSTAWFVAGPALAYPKVIVLHHLPGVKKRRETD